MRKAWLLPIASLAALPAVHAHCPLCTLGAAAAAGGAAYLGVNSAAIGVFLGAFAAAIGLWVARILPKEYVKYQKQLLVILSFITTIWPLMPLLGDSHGFYLALFGEYGSLLHRTYLYDAFLLGSLVGLVIMLAAPWLSTKVSALRKGKKFPYQGITITFVLLLLVSVLFQVVL